MKSLKSLGANDDVMETWRELVAQELIDGDDESEFE